MESGHKYRLGLERFGRFQIDRGRPLDAAAITKDDVYEWKDSHAATWSQRHAVSIVNQWLAFHGNERAALRGYRWPHEEPAAHHWMTDAEMNRFESVGVQPLSWIAHCGLRLALRREEWLNLRVGDVAPETVYIFEGKGRKSAPIPSAMGTLAAFDAVMQWREGVLATHPAWESDDTILVVPYRGAFKTPSLAWADNQVERLTGGHYTSHDMRRSAARRLYLAGVPKDHVRRFLRHEKQETTDGYIGAVMDAVSASIRAAETRGLLAPL